MILLTVAQGCGAQQVSGVQDPLDFQLARFSAQVDVDTAFLEAHLADDLIYTHSNAVVETKDAFLATLTSGKINYLSLTRTAVSLREVGDTAIMTGVCRLEGAAGKQRVRFSLRILDVSQRQGNI